MYLNYKQLKTFADTIGASTGEDGLLYPNQPVSQSELLTQLLFPHYPMEGQMSESKHIEGHWWEVTWYVYQDRIYSVHSRYHHQKPALQPNEEWLPHPTGYGGYVVRFYRVGCTHPHMKRETLATHQHRDYCPDCGYEEVVWSD